MDSIRRILERQLRLKVNEAKSAVARPWKRKFLGYSMTWHTHPRLKVAKENVARLKREVRRRLRRGRGQSLQSTVDDLSPLLRGWVNYFRLAEVKGVFEDLDKWLRRKLRCVLWRQWKRAYTRARKLMQRGLERTRAWQSARNGRGPWWNAGASHMNQAYPKRFFDRIGLVSLLHQRHRLQTTT